MDEVLERKEESAVPVEYVEKDTHYTPPPLPEEPKEAKIPTPTELANMRRNYIKRLKDENEVLMLHTINMELKIKEYKLTKEMEKINEDILKERIKDEGEVK